MAHQSGRHLRLSTTELENAVREEKKKWRIFRLQQVREQARIEAERVRAAVDRKQKRVVHRLGQEVLQKWQKNKENEVEQLQEEYNGCFQAFGKAHAEAKEQPDAVEMLEQQKQINRRKAARRGCDAVRVQNEHNVQKERDKNMHIQHRKSAITKEKLRASHMAQLPTPEAFKKKKIVVPKPVPKVQLYEHGTLTTTNYVPKNIVIEKEIASTKPSAHKLAEAEERIQASIKETERIEAEDIERKREERGQAALHKERLHRMYQDMIDRLDQLHHNHELSAYIRGADLSIYDSEEARQKAWALLQRDMEVAVEKVLEDKKIVQAEEYMPQVVDVIEDVSDLKEVSDGSRIDTFQEPQTTDGRDFHVLQEEIRRRRHLISQELVSHQDSPLERASAVADIEDTQNSEVSRDGETLEQTETRADRVDHRIHYVQSDEEISEEERERSTLCSSETTPPEDIRHQNQNIHFAETVPAHLMPQDRVYREMPVKSSSTQLSSSEKTLQPESSDDIEVRIHLSSDSSTISSQPSVLHDQNTRSIMPRGTDRPHTRDPEELVYSGGDSTEYLSLPSSFSPARENAPYLENLAKIQAQRQNIQKILDGKGSKGNKEMVSPVTYMQEMNTDESPRKISSKRQKFELQKREILHHYIRKLLNLREDELMQLSASTVEGSGMTVSSLCTLLESLRRDDNSSLFSSDIPQSSSEAICSAIYPDIDEVPTKLSNSPEFFVSPSLLPNAPPRVCPDYEPRFYFSHEQIIDASSSSGTLIYPHDVQDSETCKSYRKLDMPHMIPSVERMGRSPDVNKFLSVEESGTSSYTSDVRYDNQNLQRELKIIQDLRALQILKQELLLKKNNILKDSEEVEKMPESENRTNATSIQLTGQDLQTTRDTSFSNIAEVEPSRHSNPYSMNTRSALRDRRFPSQTTHVGTKVRKEERDSDDSEDNFVVLKPSTANRSIPCSSEASSYSEGLRKPAHDRSVTRTRFQQLIPEATMQSEIISGDYPAPSHLTGSAFSAAHNREGRTDSLGTIMKGRQEKIIQSEQSEMYDGEMRFQKPDETSSSIKEKNLSSGTVPDDTLTSVREDISSDLPKDSSKDQTTISNKADRSEDANTNQPPENSSGESVTSIPDMAEILHRFGLTWAKSMIRKMEKTEETSSSEN